MLRIVLWVYFTMLGGGIRLMRRVVGKYKVDKDYRRMFVARLISSVFVLKEEDEEVKRVEVQLQALKMDKERKYEGELHKEYIENLWNLLGDQREKDWGRIGFQGKDPATDFRGMGKIDLFNFYWIIDYVV
jgi:hypothetical protein